MTSAPKSPSTRPQRNPFPSVRSRALNGAKRESDVFLSISVLLAGGRDGACAVGPAGCWISYRIILGVVDLLDHLDDHLESNRKRLRPHVLRRVLAGVVVGHEAGGVLREQ